MGARIIFRPRQASLLADGGASPGFVLRFAPVLKGDPGPAGETGATGAQGPPGDGAAAVQQLEDNLPNFNLYFENNLI